jgi:hypothetical protein
MNEPKRARTELQIGKLLISTNDIICKGLFGSVFSGEIEDLKVAVKRVDRFSHNSEAIVLRLLNNGHSNILRYYASETDNDFL